MGYDFVPFPATPDNPALQQKKPALLERAF